MTGSSKIEVLDGPQRRRHWTAAEKLAIVQETFEPDATVSLVARRHGVAPNQLFRWRKLAAHDTKSLAREIGLEPRTTPVQSPQSNGMAEAFVRTIKRDYVRVSPLPDARTVLESLPLWFEHDNSLHPHKALGYRSPREFIASRQPG